MATSTSYRISAAARQALAKLAANERSTATAVLEQLIIEGVRQRDHPGIVFRGPGRDRRAALAAGPDVWEIVARLQELEGSAEDRISVLAEESGLHKRMLRIAVDYAASHPDEVQAAIDHNRQLAIDAAAAAKQREALLS